MILTFPNSTETLIKLNPASYPDAVRTLLRFESLRGNIRELRGRWYQIKRDPDTPEAEKAAYGSVRYRPGKPRKARKACLHCGEITGRARAKYCSHECAIASKTKARPECYAEGCKNLVNKAENLYCSRECCDKSKRGRKR